MVRAPLSHYSVAPIQQLSIEDTAGDLIVRPNAAHATERSVGCQLFVVKKSTVVNRALSHRLSVVSAASIIGPAKPD